MSFDCPVDVILLHIIDLFDYITEIPWYPLLLLRYL
jgi:hypothetical protein